MLITFRAYNDSYCIIHVYPYTPYTAANDCLITQNIQIAAKRATKSRLDIT